MSSLYHGASKELCSGVLYKCGPKFKYWNKRFFILKDDHCLYYYKDTAKGHLGVITLRDPKFSVRPGEISDASWPKNVSMDKAFVVVTNQRRYCMYSTSEDEARMWIRVLGGARERLIDESSHSRRAVSTSGLSTSPTESPGRTLSDTGRPHSEASLEVSRNGVQRQPTYEEMGPSDHLMDSDAIYDMAKAEENSISSRSGSGTSSHVTGQTGEQLYEEVAQDSITSQPLPPLPPTQAAADVLYEDIGDQQQPVYESVVPVDKAQHHDESPPPLPRKDSNQGPPLPPRQDPDAPPLPSRGSDAPPLPSRGSDASPPLPDKETPPSPVKRSPLLPRKQSPPLPPKDSPPVQRKEQPPLPPKATPDSSPSVMRSTERPCTPPPRSPRGSPSAVRASPHSRSNQSSPLLTRESPQLSRACPLNKSPTLPPKANDLDDLYEVPPTEAELEEAGIELAAESPQLKRALLTKSPTLPPKDDENLDDIYEVPPTESELGEAGIKLSDLDTDGSPPLKHKSPHNSHNATPPQPRPESPPVTERVSSKPSPQPRRKQSSEGKPKPAPRKSTEGPSDRGHDLFRSRQARLDDLEATENKRRAQTLQLLGSDEVNDKVSFANTLREVEQEKLAASEEKFRWERERMKFEEERQKFEAEKRKLQEQLEAARKQLEH